MLSANTYIARRQRLVDHVKSGMIILMGNELVGMNYADNAYPFYQDGSFLYYFGLQQPFLAGVIDIDRGETYLIGDAPSTMDMVFLGVQPQLQSCAEKVGVNDCLSWSAFSKKIKQCTYTSSSFHYLPQYSGNNALKISESLGISPFTLTPSPLLIKSIILQREVKSPEEVEETKLTLVLTETMHRLAMRHTVSGRYERDVVAKMYQYAIEQGRSFAYNPIFSVDGHILHNHHYDNRMQNGQLLLNDSGLNSPCGYATDITRTFPVNGRFTAQQADVYQIVESMQDSVYALLKSGENYQACHLAAAKTALTHLAALGLIKGNIDDALAQGAYGLFFPHGLGHLLGLDVHDMEGLGERMVGYSESVKRAEQFGLSALRLGKKLRSGMLLTVEPGIYFIPSLIDQWQSEKKLKDIIQYDALASYRYFGGIRIEDNILITDDGYQNLSHQIPRAIADVEAACRV